MNWRQLSCVITALVLVTTVALPQTGSAGALSQVAIPKPSKPQFFAGLVIEADMQHVKVSRNLVGRPTETRVFSLDAKTKTPKGGIKPKTRVTVRYQHMPEQDLALEIQVRPLSRTPKTT